MKKTICIALFALLSFTGSAQTPVKLEINHLLGSAGFAFSQQSMNNQNVQFNVGRLEYYISGISITHDNGTVTKCEDVYILVDPSQELRYDLGTYTVDSVEAISFSIGVNSPENNEDPTQWPAGHALAPKSPSMHWGWSAGYRFVAMEGKAGSSLSTTYEIHALGNDNYHKISIPVKAMNDNDSLIIQLNADYARAIENIDVSKGIVNHGDVNEAAELLRNFRDHVFTSTDGEGNTLFIPKDPIQANLLVYPLPSLNGNFTISLSNTSSLGITNLRIFGMDGRLLQQIEHENAASVKIALEQKGIYFAEIYSDDVRIGILKLVVQ